MVKIQPSAIEFHPGAYQEPDQVTGSMHVGNGRFYVEFVRVESDPETGAWRATRSDLESRLEMLMEFDCADPSAIAGESIGLPRGTHWVMVTCPGDR